MLKVDLKLGESGDARGALTKVSRGFDALRRLIKKIKGRKQCLKV